MKNKKLLGFAILLLLTMANFNRLKGNENIRTVQFLSIFAIGMLSGLLLHELVVLIKSKKSNS